MYWDVTKVEPLPGHRIRVEFESGRKGIFDLTPYLEQGVFRELKDPAYFNQVFVLFGAVTWPNEQDIAPETLLAELIELRDDTVNIAVSGLAGHCSDSRPDNEEAECVSRVSEA